MTDPTSTPAPAPHRPSALRDPRAAPRRPAPPGPDIDPDLVADVLLALETAPILAFRLSGVATVERGGARALVTLHLGGRDFYLTPAEARMTARCIGFEDQRRATGLLVSLFHSAACDADAMHASVLRRMGEVGA